MHTPAESPAFVPDVTRDGNRLVFMVDRYAGKGGVEIRTKSLVDDQETLVISWGPSAQSREGRIGPRWSPDGTRLAYMYWGPSGEGTRAMVADARTGLEQPITSFLFAAHPFDWSNDGKSLLASLKRTAADPVGVWTIPLAAAPEAEKHVSLIASDVHYELWQPRFSPDDRWVVFNAVAQPDQSWSTLYVVPAAGGSWTQITEGTYWDDKPRWSPDGKSIYFISSRDGLFNVWAVAFDPERGQVEGDPVRVTAFNGPRRRMLPNVVVGDITVSRDRLFLCLQETSGSIWTLDNVDR